MTPLTVYGVSAPESCAFRSELRVVPRKEMPFVPDVGMVGVFFYPYSPQNVIVAGDSPA